MNLEDIKTWKVLLVDDEPDNLEVVSDTLEFFGMTVRTASNGQVCLDVLNEWMPDLILLDLSMPVMDGWATLRHLKSDEKTKHLPVLTLSAHAIVGDSQRALDAGFDGYMTKPVNVPTLVQDLREALKKFADSTPVQPETTPVIAASAPLQPATQPVVTEPAARPDNEAKTVEPAAAKPETGSVIAEPVPAPVENKAVAVETIIRPPENETVTVESVPAQMSEIRKDTTV